MLVMLLGEISIRIGVTRRAGRLGSGGAETPMCVTGKNKAVRLGL